MDTEEIIFVANDTVDNIARIKSASWRILATAAAIFAFLNSSLIDEKSLIFINIFYMLGLLFFIFLVCRVYPRKIQNYRKRLSRCYESFSKETQKTHGDCGNISNEDSGDILYSVVSYIYLVILLISHLALNFV